MARAEQRKSDKPGKTGPKGIAQIYSTVRRKTSTALRLKHYSELKDLYLCCVKASFSKCIDFNEIINAERLPREASYLYLGTLRGLCEDLIVLRYLGLKAPSFRNRYLTALTKKNLLEGIAVQRAFFQANNPLQPVIGAGENPDRGTRRVEHAKEGLKRAALQVGLGPRPRVSDMARAVGLTTTYEYVYYISSNFVHFNPNALMRMGWSKESKEQNFSFSIENMAGYYDGICKFYGGIVCRLCNLRI